MRRTIAKRTVLCILAALLTAWPLVSHAQKPELPVEYGPILDAVTADASGNYVGAAAAAAGPVSGLKNYAFFSEEGIPVILNAAVITGYTGIYSRDGGLSGEYKIAPGSAARLFGFTRIEETGVHKHFACVLVMSTAANGTQAQERYLWINSLGGSQPKFVPANTGRNLFEHGPAVSFETGIPNIEVLMTDENGTPITTAMSDENGLVVFDEEHTADGRTHLTSLTWSFGNYNYHTATAYAASHLLPSVGGTDHEWVANNSCATFQSRVLSAAGFPVYAPYTEGANNPGQGVWATLKMLIGDAYCKKTFTIDDFHEGDIIWIKNMGHAMYCSAVNREDETIHVYAHSTSVTSPYTDDCWIPISAVSGVAQMVTEDVYGHDYRINGIANPRQVVFDANGGTGEMERVIAALGDSVELPACGFEAPALKAFAGWSVEGEAYAPADPLTVEDHAVVTATWTDAIRLGIADLVLPAALTAIEDGAFEGIAAASVWIPDSCGSIGSGAFAACPNLRQVRVPADCSIDPSAFAGCGPVTLFGPAGGTAEQFCNDHEGFTFEAE